jgi:hypothetical protein
MSVQAPGEPVPSGDLGKWRRVKVTATNSDGSVSGHSRAYRVGGEIISIEGYGFAATNANGRYGRLLFNLPYSATGYSPALSPDGLRLAYATNVNPQNPSTTKGDTSIWVANIDGTNQIAVADTPFNDKVPRWSPDGTKLVFESVPGSCSGVSCSGANFVWVANADGSGKTQIYQTPGDELTNYDGAEHYPEWSRFDNRIHLLEADGIWHWSAVAKYSYFGTTRYYGQYESPPTPSCVVPLEPPPGGWDETCMRGQRIISLNPDGSGRLVELDNGTSSAIKWNENCPNASNVANRCRILYRLRVPTPTHRYATNGNSPMTLAKAELGQDPPFSARAWSHAPRAVNHVFSPDGSQVVYYEYGTQTATRALRSTGAVLATWGSGASATQNSDWGFLPASAQICIPTNVTPPVVSGFFNDGELLQTAGGTWSNCPVSLSYQWQRCDQAGSACVDLFGATGQSYRLTPADVGSRVRVRVTATNPDGTASVVSSPSPVIGSREQALARLFRPHLLFDEGEHWRPISMDAFLDEKIDGVPAHQVCFRDASHTNRDCTPAQSTADLLSFEATHGSGDGSIVLDVNGDERDGGEAEDYRAPSLDGCTVRADSDCDSGPDSIIYYNRTIAENRDGEPGTKSYWDYWYFFRYNHSYWSTGCGLGIIDLCFEHEGDWEGVTVVTSVEPDPTVYWVGYGGHNYPPRRYSADALRQANRFTSGNHIGVYVAAGTHAAYSFPCDEDDVGCSQDNESGGVGGLPEAQHGGEDGWSRNADSECASDCVQPLPEGSATPTDLPNPAGWTNWSGYWGNPCDSFGSFSSPGCGRAAGPQSPGRQGRYTTPWDTITPSDPARVVGWASRSLETADSDRAKAQPTNEANCSTWFGLDVVALACDEATLRQTLAKNKFDHGSLRVGVRGARTTSSWPGLAQTIGKPLRDGETIRLAGNASGNALLFLHVALDRKTVAAARFNVQDVPRGRMLTVRTGGTRYRPVVRLVDGGTGVRARSVTLPVRPPDALRVTRQTGALRLRFTAAGQTTVVWVTNPVHTVIEKRVLATRPGARTTLVLRAAPSESVKVVVASRASNGNYSRPAIIAVKR